MSTKLIKYNDNEVITNGTTTIVYGMAEVRPTGKVVDSMNKATKAMQDLFDSYVVAKGVAKLAPGDTFDAETGRVVASKKAERTSSKVLRKTVTKAIVELENLVNVLKEDRAALDARCDTLSVISDNKPAN